MTTSTKISRWTQDHSGIAAQADTWFENYRFHDGEILPSVRIHYATLW